MWTNKSKNLSISHYNCRYFSRLLYIAAKLTTSQCTSHIKHNSQRQLNNQQPLEYSFNFINYIFLFFCCVCIHNFKIHIQKSLPQINVWIPWTIYHFVNNKDFRILYLFSLWFSRFSTVIKMVDDYDDEEGRRRRHFMPLYICGVLKSVKTIILSQVVNDFLYISLYNII